MAPLPRLGFPHLAHVIRSLPANLRYPEARSIALGIAIAKYFLGPEWAEKHVLQKEAASSPSSGFMRINWESENRGQIASYRAAELGELLFNLQNVPGFDERIEQMKTMDPESCLAELLIARMLYINDWVFSFVKRTGERGKDYDFEINM